MAFLTNRLVLDAVLARIDTVSEVGVIKGELVYGKKGADVNTTFLYDGSPPGNIDPPVVRGWQVRYDVEDAVTEIENSTSVNDVFINWQIVVFWQAGEAGGTSEQELFDTVEEVRDAFRTMDVDGIETVIDKVAGLQIKSVSYDGIAATDCHVWALSLQTQHQQQVGQ